MGYFILIYCPGRSRAWIEEIKASRVKEIDITKFCGVIPILRGKSHHLSLI